MPSGDEVRTLGEECPAEFFRIVIESLADSFDPSQADAYEHLMQAWIPALPACMPVIPALVDTVYVLSRVTLGADIKITSAILDAMKQRFPEARIVLVGTRKSAELFAADERIEHLEAEYPRSGPVSARIAFAGELRARLAGENRIVVDPDSRMTQLGLLPLCEPEHAFHFSSRTAGGRGNENLSSLVGRWLQDTFGQAGCAFMAPVKASAEGRRPWAAVSLGVGENETKRVGGDFETRLIHALSERYGTVWIDRGVGGEEAQRVSLAVERAGVADRVKFWEGSFAGFASIIARSDLYVGYDSAGQHAAAAAGARLITIFAGASSERFRARWEPAGEGSILVIPANGLDAEACFQALRSRL